MTGIDRFSTLASGFASAASDWLDHGSIDRRRAVEETLKSDNSFTPEALDLAIDTLLARIDERSLGDWIGQRFARTPMTVGVLNAGNVPFVGLQDLLAVTLTGHHYAGVMSSKSPSLLPAFTASVRQRVPELPVHFSGFGSTLAKADALLATGADSTVSHVSAAARRAGIEASRQLLRGTRTSLAVLDGSETSEDLAGLASDALLHEGRGCLNVSIVLAKTGTDRGPIIRAFEEFRKKFPPHPLTMAGLALEERFLRATRQEFHSSEGFLILVGERSPRRPCVVVWSEIAHVREAELWIAAKRQRLQVVVASDSIGLEVDDCPRVDFGTSQDPPIDWMPDGRDGVKWLASLA